MNEDGRTASQRDSLAFTSGAFRARQRCVPAETAIAISINGSTHAVMMATPDHVAELGLGLALNERIVARADEVEHIEVVETELGLDCQVWLTEARAARYTARRRQMAGPVGCGLCGAESLEQAGPALPEVAGWAHALAPAMLTGAVAAMAERQVLSRETRAVHACAFHRWRGHEAPELVVIREDVGRHNALDKVAGHCARAGVDPADGFLTITSRVSVELIQKAAEMGCGLIAAVSAPTALALERAEAAGITLVAVVRGDEFEVFTHPDRIAGARAALARSEAEPRKAAAYGA